MCCSSYVGLKMFLDSFMSDVEIISLMIGPDALVLIFRSNEIPEKIKDKFPAEIEYCNEHYIKKNLSVMKVKTEIGYDHTDIHVITYLYKPPMLHTPPAHNYNLDINNIMYTAYEIVRKVKALDEEDKKSAADRCDSESSER